MMGFASLYPSYSIDGLYLIPWNAPSLARSFNRRREFAAGHLQDLAFPAAAVVHQNNSARRHLTGEWLLFHDELSKTTAWCKQQG